MKKIDLHISKYGEITLVPNPDFGTYIINTIKLDESNISNFIEEIKKIIPYWFKYEVIDGKNSIKIFYNNLDFVINLTSFVNNRKTALKIYVDDTFVNRYDLNTTINSFNLFKAIFETATKEYYLNLKLNNLLEPLLQKIYDDAGGIFLKENIKITKFNCPDFWHYSDNLYKLTITTGKEYDYDTNYIIKLIDFKEIKFVGKLVEKDWGDKLVTIADAESDVKAYTARLNTLNHFKELIEA